MNLLALSYGSAAIAQLLPTAVEIIYINDAALPFGSARFVTQEQQELIRLGHRLTVVTLAEQTPEVAARIIGSAQAVYMCGGMTDTLLSGIQRARVAGLLCERARAGMPLAGSSAGAIVLGADIAPGLLLDGPAEGVALESTAGLGLVDGVVLPHADGALPPYTPELIEDIAARLGEDFPDQQLWRIPDERGLLVRDEGAVMVDSPHVPAG